MSFVFESPNDDRMSDFDLKLMQIDQEHLGVPEAEFDVTVDMPSNEFKRICSDMATFSDKMVITVNKESIEFAIVGDVGGGTVVLRKRAKTDTSEAVAIQCGADVQQKFSLKHLNLFGKAATLSPTVILRMSDKQPVEVSFSIVENPDNGWIKFYLAPQMADEEGA
eukprot:GHVU01125812.1.p1 GENE.GHVU01125812.1~~GHVU01125812.1.p1  ORF type:complete len:166 (-),score=30.82 GHVU01125812.1:155-652(-)